MSCSGYSALHGVNPNLKKCNIVAQIVVKYRHQANITSNGLFLPKTFDYFQTNKMAWSGELHKYSMEYIKRGLMLCRPIKITGYTMLT